MVRVGLLNLLILGVLPLAMVRTASFWNRLGGLGRDRGGGLDEEMPGLLKVVMVGLLVERILVEPGLAQVTTATNVFHLLMHVFDVFLLISWESC